MASHAPIPPGSGEPPQDDYGPTLLATLEYIAHICGIHPHLGQVWFSLGAGKPYVYEALFSGHAWRIDSDGARAEIRMDGRLVEKAPCGLRVITDEAGRVLSRVRIEREE